MRRLLPVILTLFIFLTQVGLEIHTYQDHNSNDVCQLCLTGSQQNNALTSTPVTPSVAAAFPLQEAILPASKTQPVIHAYRSRAPPAFL